MPVYKYTRTQTAGADSDSSQVFQQNKFIDYHYSLVIPFSFDVPQYTTYGGTYDYYGQNSNAIFTSFNKPYIRFVFTGNTHSLSGNSLITHEVYKLSNQKYSNLLKTVSENSSSGIDSTTRTIDTIREDSNGNSISEHQEIKESLSKGSYKSNDVGLYSKDILCLTLSEPMIVYSAQTSGITLPYYDFYPDVYYKKNGSNKESLFEDKGQYFINSYFSFNWNKDLEYTDQISLDGGLIYSTYESNITLNTSSPVHEITGGTLQGCGVRGRFFTYLTIPNKPKFEEPIMSGQQDTFSPIVYFSNTEDGDEHVLQVCYNVSDSGFTGTIFSYKFDRDTDQSIQKISVPLKSNSNFSYRVGNIKSFVNLFDVKNSIVSFTDILTGTTQLNPVSFYVCSEVDSVLTGEMPICVSPPTLTPEFPSGDFVLSGMVHGSVVTGATVHLTYPDGTLASTTTDSIGNFQFIELPNGVYSIATSYRGYKDDSRLLQITGNTFYEYYITTLAGNIYDTVGYLGDNILGNYI